MKLAQLNQIYHQNVVGKFVFVFSPRLVYSSSVLGSALQRDHLPPSTVLTHCITNVAAAQLILQRWVGGLLGGWRVKFRLFFWQFKKLIMKMHSFLF